MDPASVMVLVECRLREMIIEETPAEDLQTEAAQDDWLEQSIHGPHYNTRRWFGATSPTIGRRYLRAIGRLEVGGWLTTFRRSGRRLTNIKLTNAGTEFTEKL